MTPGPSRAAGHAPRNRSRIIEPGIDGGPCPAGNPAIRPRRARPARYNSNVNSYTPYFVHLTRRDTEQEITSYSLVLPKGITGKLAGIPFCPDAAIEALAQPARPVDEQRTPPVRPRARSVVP